MNKGRIILFGGVGAPDEFGGELTKNKEIIARLRELGYKLTIIDTYRCNHDKRKLLRVVMKFLWSVLIHPRATFLFSTSFKNMYPLFKVLIHWPVKLHIVYWVIGGNLVDRIKAGAYEEKYLRMASLYIVEGQKMKRELEELGYRNVYYMPNFKTIHQLPTINKYNDEKIHFVFLSRIMPEKGADLILESVKRLNEKGLANKFCIDFYGGIDDGYKGEFLKTCEELPNVCYAGKLMLLDPKNYDVLARYHYMLFPTRWVGEGFPGVIIDAYMAGLPIIASDWNFNEEFVINGKTGYVIPTNSIEALAEVMEKAIFSNDSYCAMVENCQKQVCKYETKHLITPNVLNITTIMGGGNWLHAKLKRNQLIFFLVNKLRDKDYKRYRKAMTGAKMKSHSQVKEEMRLYSDYWCCDAYNYVRYGLFNKSLSKEEILDYIPTYYYYNYYLPQSIGKVNVALYEDKRILFHLFKQHEIPTPEVIATVENGVLCDADGLPFVTTQVGVSPFNVIAVR